MAQYCGISGPSSCPPDSSLPTPGLTDYRTFPCVSRGVAFSSNIQLYFPDTVTYAGFTVSPDSVHIDSITNLPCGLCWSANKSSLTYNRLERGCVNISGTTTDSSGTYLLGMYGKAYLGGSPFPGSLGTFWANFYVSVKDAADPCSHSIGTLRSACGAPTSCTITPQVQQLAPTTPCGTGDSAVFIVTAPYLSQTWTNLTTFDTAYTPSVTVPNLSPSTLSLQVVDSALCTGTMYITVNSDGGHLAPEICYFTTDTTLPYPNVVVAVQRNNIFNTIAYCALYGSNVGNNYDTILSSINASLPAIFTDTFFYKYYGVESYFNCGSGSAYASFVQYSKLNVDSDASGYPRLTWPLQLPITYSSIFVLARPHGGAWEVRDTIYSVNATNFTITYVDHSPDSTQMDYMLGYNLDNTCDPSRSGSKTVFTNVTPTSVRQALVVAHPSGPNGITDADVQPSIELYPNPVIDILRIRLSGDTKSTPVTIKMYDMLGHLAYTKDITVEQSAIDMSGYAHGIYTLKAYQHNDQLLSIKKIVKD